MTPEQLKALDIATTCWVNASAGSGKTSLLVARIVRLLLDNVSGRTILCVTFTKRAALEMQERLDHQVMVWSTCDTVRLQKEMMDMMGRQPSPEAMSRARLLKATLAKDPVIIQTFHSFCHDALMRFPIEAHLNMPLHIWDQAKALHMWEQALDGVLIGMDPRSPVGMAVQRLVGLGIRMPVVLAEMFHQRLLPGIEYDAEAMNFSVDDFLKAHPNPLPELCEIETTDKIWIEKWHSVSRGSEEYRAIISAKMTKSSGLRHESLQYWHQKEKDLMQIMADAAVRMKKAQKDQDCEKLFRQVMQVYEGSKSGALDFDDLTLKTVDLLEHSAYSGWVAHTFYHALNHILVDEAQDTSRHQWKILRYMIEAVIQKPHRTVCVVGDPKQSIYGFQGADPEGFFLMRNFVKAWVLAQDGRFCDVELTVSFRSAPAVLKIVNAVFAQKDRINMPFSNHTSFHVTRPGLVEMWACGSESEATETSEEACIKLADQWIQTLNRWMQKPFFLPSQQRLVQPEDILIILPRRTTFFKNLQTQLHGSGWLTRKDMSYKEDPVIHMMVAWCRVILHVDDDMALAELIDGIALFGKQPSLFQAAYQRGRRSIWQNISNLSENQAFFSALCAYVQGVRQGRASCRLLDLVVRWVYEEGGEVFLLAFGGANARNAVDAFIQALQHWPDADDGIGFLDWVQRDDTIFKTTQSGGVQLLTIHGAKGAQAPVVIVPDLPPPVDKDDPEYWRLFYVAMTRAQDRLYLSSRKESGLWYQAVMDAMMQVQATPSVSKDTSVAWKYTCADPILNGVESVQSMAEPLADTAPVWLAGSAVSGNLNGDLEANLEGPKETYGTFTWLMNGLRNDAWGNDEIRSKAFSKEEGEGSDDGVQDGFIFHGGALNDAMAEWRYEDLPSVTELQDDLHREEGLKQLEQSNGAAMDFQKTQPQGKLQAESLEKSVDQLQKSASKKPIPREKTGEKTYAQTTPRAFMHRRRGAALHQLLEELPNISSEKWFTTALDFLERQGLGPSHSQRWARCVVGLLQRKDLRPLFFEARAEVEWCGPGQLRRMDRVLVRSDDVWIVDFKSDHRPISPWQDTPYVNQMQRYVDLMGPLYPEKRLHQGILWLKIGILQWHPESLCWDI